MNLYNQVIRHKRFMDVCCLVIKDFKTQTKHKLKIMWMNQGYKKSYFIDQVQNIEIQFNDLKDWEICLDKYPTCYRYAKWKGL